MTGFSGVFSTHPLDRENTAELLLGMAQDITFAPGGRVESYCDDRVGVARVHHGVLNVEPQPIFNEDGSLSIVMDGEVFGYERERRLLEDLGHRFRHESNDAEYCLHLFEEHGAEAFVKLDGSFALMIYNHRTSSLWLVSDRVSSCPLFYHRGRDHTLFGTQLRPLLRHPAFPRDLDLRTVFEFFALGGVLWDHTFYKDVKALLPGTALRVHDGAATPIRYWTPESGDHTEPAQHYVAALAQSLREAVARKTRGDHRFGILMSGGLDSRAIVACAEKPVTAFTLGESWNREIDLARRAVVLAGGEHVFVRRASNHYPNLVDEAIAIGDGMQRFDHAHVLGSMDEIRERCDVVLDGFGFDAKLKGLGMVERRVSLLGRNFLVPCLRQIPDVDSAASWAGLRSFRYLPTFHEFFRAPYRQTARDVFMTSLEAVLKERPPLHPQDRFAYPLVGSIRCVGGYLMVLAARAHMPQRSVMFDSRLLELAAAIPPQLRARGRALRRALRRLSPELAALPDGNTGLRADLPVWWAWLIVSVGTVLSDSGVLPQPRLSNPTHGSGSWPDWAELVRHNDKLRTMIETTLNDPACLNPDLFDMQAVSWTLREHIERRADTSRRLFQLLTFGRWHKKYGPG